ncbi:MAG: hypothetical protein J6S53_07995 [Lentisphaeria bacterium]|nr:hypothetical protein [Lentisphaeria bacterium]
MCIKKIVSEFFRKENIHLFSSWSWVQSDFAEEFAYLQKNSLLEKDAPGSKCIWATRQKYVLKLVTPSGRSIACKKYHLFRNPQHFLNRATPAGLEALNYQEIASLHIPTAKILAAGEKRRFFFPREAFFITEFLEGTSDGREFLSGGQYCHKTEWKDEFIKKNIRYLALFHDNDFLHKGFTPFNMLWKEKPLSLQKEGDLLDIFWIDAATCRKIKDRKKLFSGKGEDFALFFSFFDFTEEERKEYILFYTENTRTLECSFEEFFLLTEKYYNKKLEKRRQIKK